MWRSNWKNKKTHNYLCSFSSSVRSQGRIAILSMLGTGAHVRVTHAWLLKFILFFGFYPRVPFWTIFVNWLTLALHCLLFGWACAGQKKASTTSWYALNEWLLTSDSQLRIYFLFTPCRHGCKWPMPRKIAKSMSCTDDLAERARVGFVCSAWRSVCVK